MASPLEDSDARHRRATPSLRFRSATVRVVLPEAAKARSLGVGGRTLAEQKMGLAIMIEMRLFGRVGVLQLDACQQFDVAPARRFADRMRTTIAVFHRIL